MHEPAAFRSVKEMEKKEGRGGKEGGKEGVVRSVHPTKLTLTKEPEGGRCAASSTHVASFSAISSGCHCMNV